MAKRALGPATLAVVQAVEAVARGPLLVGCSGGADSLALAVCASIAARRTGVALRVLVVDHGLQKGSREVAEAVVAQLAERDIEALVTTVVVDTAGDGVEAAARAARYEALSAVAREDELVLLGHTLDDQAETVLLGLARGSGTRSLAGMPARRGRFVRPLLGLRASTTREACSELGLRVWDDPENFVTRYARVRVRRAVMPVLEAEVGPGVAEALARTARLARADADLLDGLAAREFEARGGERLDTAWLAGLPDALRHRILKSWLGEHGGRDLAATHVWAVDALVTDWRGQEAVDIPGARVRRKHDTLRCETVAGGRDASNG